jgi:hypothetical protein
VSKRADKVEVGDVLAGIGAVTYARIHEMNKAPATYVGIRRPRRTVAPPFRSTAKVVELRVDGRDAPLYRWPKDRLEVEA